MSEPNPAHAQISDLFSKQHASNEKLDYFLCTVAGALFAYIGQTFAPASLPLNAMAWVLASLFFLTLSFYCGYRRIQAQAAILRGCQRQIETQEEVKKRLATINDCDNAVKTGYREPAVTDNLGVSCTLDEFKRQTLELYPILEVTTNAINEDRAFYRHYGFERDALLLMGFICILTSKIFEVIARMH